MENSREPPPRSTTVHTTDLRNISARLEETLDLCIQLGLRGEVRESRFRRYSEFLAVTADFIHADDEVIQDAWGQFLEQGRAFLPAWLTEGAEFADIAPLFRVVHSKLFALKLKRVLAGPLGIDDEDAQSNLARNTLFELVVASKLSYCAAEYTQTSARQAMSSAALGIDSSS